VKLVETWSMNRFYTIGYWGWRDVREFIEFLKDLGIRILVDVRRFPRSKNSGFNRENLEAELNKHTMRYVFMGETLGGYGEAEIREVHPVRGIQGGDKEAARTCRGGQPCHNVPRKKPQILP